MEEKSVLCTRFQSMCTDYLNYLITQRGVSYTTAIVYRDYIRRYLKSNIEPEKFYIQLISDYTYSSSYKHNMYFAIKWFLKMQNKEFNIKKPKLEKRVRQNLSLEKCWSLIDTMRDNETRMFVLIALNSGLRPNEIIRLKVEDIDFEENILTIRNTKSYRERLVPINKKTSIEIRKYLYQNNISSGRIIKNKLRYFQMWLNKYSKELGFTVTPYMLRHTFATMFVENGGNILILKNILGHSDIKTTEGYIHESKRMLKKGYERACPEF